MCLRRVVCDSCQELLVRADVSRNLLDEALSLLFEFVELSTVCLELSDFGIKNFSFGPIVLVNSH